MTRTLRLRAARSRLSNDEGLADEGPTDEGLADEGPTDEGLSDEGPTDE